MAVVLARKTGAGALRRPVLVALGLRQDGKKEVIDFRLARGESAAEWERFLDDLYKRGLTGEGLDMICVDGGMGLLAALPMVYDKIPVQRCWAHKIRNILNTVRKADEGRSARGDERRHGCEGPLGRPPLRRALGGGLSRRGRLPARRSRRASHLLPLQDPRRTKGGADHQRHRTPLPRGPPQNPPHGRLPGPEPPWTASSSLSSPTKTKCRESQPFSP